MSRRNCDAKRGGRLRDTERILGQSGCRPIESGWESGRECSGIVWRADRVRGLVEPQPIAGKRLADLDEAIEIGGLDKEGIRAKFVCEVEVAHVVGARKDDNANGLEGGLSAKPSKELMAVHAGQIEIEQDEGGKRIFCPILVIASAGQVSNGILGGGGDMDRVDDPGFCEGAA